MVDAWCVDRHSRSEARPTVVVITVAASLALSVHIASVHGGSLTRSSSRSEAPGILRVQGLGFTRFSGTVQLQIESRY
jgi:hypothetical protein